MCPTGPGDNYRSQEPAVVSLDCCCLVLIGFTWGQSCTKEPHRHKEKRMLLLLLATSVLKAMKADGRTDGPSTDTKMMATMEWKKKR